MASEKTHIELYRGIIDTIIFKDKVLLKVYLYIALESETKYTDNLMISTPQKLSEILGISVNRINKALKTLKKEHYIHTLDMRSNWVYISIDRNNELFRGN